MRAFSNRAAILLDPSDRLSAMPVPDFRLVFRDPNAHVDFLLTDNDDHFEGQHFDRKQAGELDTSGSFRKQALDGLKDHIDKTISGFANATGGLLVLGISTTGEPLGVDFLNEDQKNSLLDVSRLRNHRCVSRLHTLDLNGDTRTIALFLVDSDERSYCSRIRDDAAWIRQGARTAALRGLELEQLKRDRKVVEFERTRADSFSPDDIDAGLIEEFSASREYAKGTPAREILRNEGAISGTSDPEWTNAGALFFMANPRRSFAHAYVRLLRFECNYADEDERPTPTFDRAFDGPLTKQIRDFRTFVADTGFFKTFEVRSASGGFSSQPEYPPIVLDEAVVNAIAHRDYGIAQPIVCEKYADAFVVKSPGRMLQQADLPERFGLDEVRLESRLRNQRIMDWLRQMRDAKGAAFVKAIREGTRRMRDEMLELALPPPTYLNRPLETIVVMSNDIKRRTARPTGLASSDRAESDQFANLYPLEGLAFGSREGERETRRILMSRLRDKLEAHDWIIDRFDKGRIIAHLKGERERLPDSLETTVRLIPAYELSVRSIFGRNYLAVDYSLQVQPVMNLQRAVGRFDAEAMLGLRAAAVDGGALVRGRITSIEGSFATIAKFESDEVIAVPKQKVYPALTRGHLDLAVRDAAPSFDFARAIKAAALATKAGASRERARRIESVVRELAQSVFPLDMGSAVISLQENPVPLLAEGDGRRALRVQTMAEPEVEFSHHRSTPNIREGITSFGSYGDEPKDIEVIGVVQPGFEQSMRDLVARLQSGKFKYKGAERTFAAKLKLASITTVKGISIDDECRRLLQDYSHWKGDLGRILIVHTPESDYALDDVSSPYYRSKRVLLEAGVASQMVDSPTLANPDYKDLNLALNIVAKTGVTPWVLPESIPDADFFVGLSYTGSARDGRVLGFANVFNSYGRWEFYSGGNEAVSYDDREKHYRHLAEQTLAGLSLSETPSICFHYSARFSRADRDAILEGAKAIRPNGRFTFVWINTHHPVRLFDRTPDTDGSLARGRFVVTAPNQILLSTTGYNQYRKTLGTPQALEINVYEDGARTQIDHRALARQILSLTKLNWASTDSLCGEPITTKYAKDIAYLTAAFERQKLGKFYLHPKLARTPWFI